VIPTYRPYIGKKELEAIQQVFESRWLGMGPQTKRFEENLAQFLGARHVLTVSSCTAAMHLALLSLGVGPGDEVVLPSFTFAATAQAVVLCGASPVFCEVSADNLTMDVNDVRKRLGSRTRVIMPVHFGGSVCEMDEIINLAESKGLGIVEDAAHAFGSTYKGRMVGTLGDVTCFSFDAIKNITCGDGGAVVTDNDKIAKSVRLKRYLGITRPSWQRNVSAANWYYEVASEGYRYHMNDLHAAIGLVQLERFEDFKGRKHEIVRLYDEALSTINGIKLIKRDLKNTFPFGYFVKVPNGGRDALIRHLRQDGIDTRVQFIPNHLQPAFAQESVRLPVTEQIYEEILTLPLYFEMSDSDVKKVITCVRSFFGSKVPMSVMRGAFTNGKRRRKTGGVNDIVRSTR